LVKDSQIKITDAVVMGDVNQTISGNECPGCFASNVRVMMCQISDCEAKFCELCHAKSRFSEGHFEPFDSGHGSGPFCAKCLISTNFQYEVKKEEKKRIARERMERERRLRRILTHLEKTKVEIDQDLFDLQCDTSILVENRDKRIPELKKYRTESMEELPILKQKIQDIEHEIDSLIQKKQSFDVTNNVMEIQDTVGTLTRECDSLLKLQRERSELNEVIYGALFAVICGVLLTYAAYNVISPVDDKTYICPDGTTIVSYNQLMDGTNDCPEGWDEKNSFWGTEDGHSAKNRADGDNHVAWIFAILIIIAGVVGGATFGTPVAEFIEKKYGNIYGKKRSIAFAEKIDNERKHKRLLSKSDYLLEDKYKKEKQIAKLRSQAETIESNIEKLNSLEIKSHNLNVINKKSRRIKNRKKPVVSRMRNLKEDDSIPYLENEVDKQIISISERIDQVRSKSNKIVDTFNQLKHLIPNSDSVNPTSSDLEDILNEISKQVWP